MALTKIGYTLIKDNFKDSVSGSSTEHSSSFSTRVTTAESELGNTLLSGSAQIASNISGSRDAASISGSRDAASISGSLGANASTIRTLSSATVSGSFGNQRVGTTDDVKFVNITGSAISSSVGKFTTIDIDGGTINGITDLAVADGGTGVSSLTDGGVLLGSGTSGITAMSVLADSEMIVGDGSTDPVAESGATLRTSIGVGTTDDVKFANITGSNNISASGNLSITGNVDVDGTSNFTGNVTLQNDLVVTGRIDAEEIHTTFISSSIAQATGSTIFGDSINDSHQFTGSIDVSGSGTVLKVSDGNVVVSDTLTATNIGAFTAAGAIDFDNQNMTNVDIDSGVITGITDITVADGGTGVSTLTDGGVLLGSGTSAITAMAVLTDGQMIVGDGTTDPVAESGATLRTSIGVGTTDDVKFANITGSGNISGSFTSTGSFGSVVAAGTGVNSFTGNVGIDTNNPLAPLHISKDVTQVSSSAESKTQAGLYLNFDPTAGSNSVTMFALSSSVATAGSYGIQVANSTGTGQYPFVINPYGGNVGIGTTAPANALDVSGSVDDAIIYLNAPSGVAQLKLDSGANTNAGINLREAGTSKWSIFNDGDASDKLIIEDDGDIRMTIQQDGNIGIGTTTPSGSLHLSTTGTQIMYLEGDSNNSGQEDCYIKFLVDGQSQEALVGWDNNNTSTLFSGNTENSFVMGCRSNLPLVFATNNTERMQITAAGFVGIGHSDPKKMLHIRKNDTDCMIVLDAQDSIADKQICFAEDYGSGSTSDGQYWGVGVDASEGPDFVIAYDQNSQASMGGDDDKLRIKANGNTGIGRSPSYPLDVNQSTATWTTRLINTVSSGNAFGLQIQFQDVDPNNTTAKFCQFVGDSNDTSVERFEVRSNGGVINYQSSDADFSDERLKKEIVDAPNFLEKINQIKVRNFKYKDQTDDRKLIGVIAQELEQVDSNLVTEENDIKRVYNKDIMFMMLKSIQELSTANDALKSRIETLENA